jgi:hypothetical protein
MGGNWEMGIGNWGCARRGHGDWVLTGWTGAGLQGFEGNGEGGMAAGV